MDVRKLVTEQQLTQGQHNLYQGEKQDNGMKCRQIHTELVVKCSCYYIIKVRTMCSLTHLKLHREAAGKELQCEQQVNVIRWRSKSGCDLP